MKLRKSLLMFFLGMLLWPSVAGAHPTPMGSIEGKIDGAVIHSTITIPERLEVENQARFQGGLRKVMAFLNDGQPCQIDLKTIQANMPSVIVLDVVCDQPVNVLSMHSEFREAEGYQFYVAMTGYGAKKEDVLGGYPAGEDAKFDFSALRPKEELLTGVKAFQRFTMMGFEHIYSGYDHMLFILALILVSPQLWSLVKIATAFTVAHSITLILSTLNIVHVPSNLVDPMIAFSIAFVAFEDLVNVYRKKKNPLLVIHSRRWLLVFGFGLFHGLGFSGALKDINIPQPLLIPSLLSFNVGVEIAQVSIIILIFPILYYLKKFQWRDRLVHALLLIIGILGAVWFVQRVILYFALYLTD